LAHLSHMSLSWMLKAIQHLKHPNKISNDVARHPRNIGNDLARENSTWQASYPSIR
jgi:hypothetical protein